MNEQYVKLAVLRAALQHGKAKRLDAQGLRGAVEDYCRAMERGFRAASNYRMAFAMRQLAQDVRYANSLSELVLQAERDAIAVVLGGMDPHSNTGPTADVEPTSVATARAKKEAKQ